MVERRDGPSWLCDDDDDNEFADGRNVVFLLLNEKALVFARGSTEQLWLFRKSYRDIII